MKNHRGFTLVEILVSLVIMGVVTGAIYKLLNTSQRVSRAQTERTDLQSNIRAGAIIVPSELREINVVPTGGTDQNDIITINGTSIRYRAMRGFGVACLPPVAGLIVVRGSTFSGYRTPVPGRDAAYVFIEGDGDKSIDDIWVPATIIGVATGNLCPPDANGSTASIALTINPTVLQLNSAGSGAPVRTWEDMELSLYPTGGQSWLGAKSWSAGEAAPQPVLGPLTDADGFGLLGLDSLGVATTARERVRSIQVTIKGLTDQAITTGTTSQGLAHVRDSLVTQVTLRNALR